MNLQQLKNIIEAALLTAGGPLPMVRLQALFVDDDEQPDVEQITQLIEALSQDYSDRGIEVKQVSSGFRIQARQEMGQWINRLSEDKPSRYSRALLETIALIAYRQPITRGGVEDIRGVSVSSSIIKTLLEREWIRVVGHRDVPGRPALYGTTKQFLDYFNLQTLGELPPLSEMRSIEDIQSEFDLNFNRIATEADVEAHSVMPDENDESADIAIIQRSDQDAPDNAQGDDSDVDSLALSDETDSGEAEAGAAEFIAPDDQMVAAVLQDVEQGVIQNDETSVDDMQAEQPDEDEDAPTDKSLTVATTG
jgi:segregation and condensation protein B